MGGRGSASSTSSGSFVMNEDGLRQYVDDGNYDLSYQRGHMPGNPADGETSTWITDLRSGQVFPKDFLDHPDWYVSKLTSDGEFNRILQTVRRAQNNPDMEVTVYRGTDFSNLNPGDWVTLSREYAEQYVGEGGNSPNGKVYSYRVKASELSFDGDALEEMGYWGKRLVLR